MSDHHPPNLVSKVGVVKEAASQFTDGKSRHRHSSRHKRRSSLSRSRHRRSSQERRASSRQPSSRSPSGRRRRADGTSRKPDANSKMSRSEKKSTLRSSSHHDGSRRNDGSSKRSYGRSNPEQLRLDKSRSRHSSNKPSRSKSADIILDDMTITLNDNDECSADNAYHDASSTQAQFSNRDSNEAIHTLYGDNEAKLKASRRKSGRATTPGVEHIGGASNRTTSTLSKDDQDVKAKMKATNGMSERAVTPGVEHVGNRSSRTTNMLFRNDSKAPETNKAILGSASNHNAATTLHGTSDADSKATKIAANGNSATFPGGVDRIFSPSSSPIWGKAKVSRGNLERTLNSSKNSATNNVLYGVDDFTGTKAKAKSMKGSNGPLINPGVEPVYINGSTHTSSISTLYGSEDSKAKAKASLGAPSYAANHPGAESVVESGRTNCTVQTLYGHDADAKADARMGSSALAAIPGFENLVSRLAMRSLSSSASRATDEQQFEDEIEEPVARRVSIGSTELMSESLSEPERKRMTSKEMEGFEVPNDPEKVSKQLNTSNTTVNDPEAGLEKKKSKSLENTSRRSRTMRIAILLLLLLLIGGSVAVWYFFFRTNGSHGAGVSVKTKIEDPTESSSLPTGTTLSPSKSPADAGTAMFPSSSPSRDLLFDPPSDLNCQDIATNNPIVGRDQMGKADFELGLELVMRENRVLTGTVLQTLLGAIQQKILPSLAGCSTTADHLVEDWRFVIFDAFVTTGRVPPDESCTDDALIDLDCHRVAVKLDLFLKGSVRFLDIIALISAEGDNFANHLGLDDLFSVIKLIGAESLIPTVAPTRAPSDAPSLNPTEFPTAKASSSPTVKPSALPTTTPTEEPSQAPSTIPSSAPSAGLSVEPSTVPSESPSVGPTNLFSVSPTVSVTPAPTSRPSTATPTGPTTKPSETPSVFPSSLPSDAPSMTSFHWVVCGEIGQCSGPASVQNSNYEAIGGSGRDIAVRCCSDTWLPGSWKRRGSTCPYAGSQIAGICYDHATHHEATALCAGIGARLCTVAEVEDNCTKGSGCGHNERWIWTSDAGP